MRRTRGSAAGVAGRGLAHRRRALRGGIRLLVVLVCASALVVEGLPAPPAAERGLGLRFPTGLVAAAVDRLTGPDGARAQDAEPDPAVTPVLYEAPQGRWVDPGSVAGLLRSDTSALEPQGRPTAASDEVESLTTESQRVVANPDGSFTAEISSGPSRFRDGQGDWREIDLTLEAQADGSMEPRQSPVRVVVAPVSAGELVEITNEEGDTLVLGFPGGAAGAPADVVDVVQPNDTARFADVLGDGIDVEVAPTAVGVETTYVLNESATAGRRLAESLTLPAGWSARQITGAIELLDEAGAVSGLWMGGSATDSAPSPYDAEVTMQLVATEDRTITAEAQVDPGWLASPERVWPVRIDPQVVSDVTRCCGGDTFVQSSYGTSQWASTELKLGTYNGGVSVPLCKGLTSRS